MLGHLLWASVNIPDYKVTIQPIEASRKRMCIDGKVHVSTQSSHIDNLPVYQVGALGLGGSYGPPHGGIGHCGSSHFCIGM